MSFAERSLTRLAQAAPIGAADGKSRAGRAPGVFHYATVDAVATVETAGYFTDARLGKGDMIMAVMVADGTPVSKTYVVTAYNASTKVATIASQFAAPA